MIVRTQNRKAIVSVSSIEIDDNNNIIGTRGKTTYLLGKYQAKARCFAILEEIESALCDSTYKMQVDGFPSKPNAVYRMPEK